MNRFQKSKKTIKWDNAGGAVNIANRIITVIITCYASAIFSSLLIERFLFRTTGIFLAVFIISLCVTVFFGIPISLIINHYVKLKTKKYAFITKLSLHFIAGILLVFIWALLVGGITEVVSRGITLFYICGAINSIIYFIIFSLLKLTGKSGFRDDKL